TAGLRLQVLMEMTPRVDAVLKRRHQDRQVLDGREDVRAVITEGRKRLRQLDDGVANAGTLAAQIVGGGVDERTQRGDSAGLGRLQRDGQLLQLRTDLVP